MREDFLWFCRTRDTTGRTLTDLITTMPQKLGLITLLDLVGQGYDSAGNMSREKRGVHTLIREKAPYAVYVHCKKLVTVHACKLSDVRNMSKTQ